MTPSQLKAHVDATGSYYFSRETLRFFGDTMRNFAVYGPKDVTQRDGTKVKAWQLWRKRATKLAAGHVAYFDTTTYEHVSAARG
jgi:hypothetical protein